MSSTNMCYLTFLLIASLLRSSLGLSKRPFLLSRRNGCPHFQSRQRSSLAQVTLETESVAISFYLKQSPEGQFHLEYSEDIQGEILFVLYKLFLLNVSQDSEDPPSLFGHFPKLLHSALAVLMKAQRDDVRLNCIGKL